MGPEGPAAAVDTDVHRWYLPYIIYYWTLVSMVPRRARSLVLAVVSILCLGLASCGDDDSGDATEGGLPTAKVALGGLALTWAPVFLAACDGSFTDAGLDVELLVTDGPSAVAALLSGDALASGTGAPSTINSQRQGAKVKMLTNVNMGFGPQFVASNGWLEKVGLTADAPLEDRIKALKGAVLAIQRPNGSEDQLIKFLISRAGMNPGTDVTIQNLNSFAAMNAAMEAGTIDLLVGSPPNGQQAEGEGIGKIFISGSEVEGLEQYPYLVLAARDADLEGDSEKLVSLLRGLQTAVDKLRDDPDGAKPCVKKSFPDLDDATFDRTYEYVLSTLPDSLLISQESYGSLVEFAKAQGDPIDVSYDDLIAHDFVSGVLDGK